MNRISPIGLRPSRRARRLIALLALALLCLTIATIFAGVALADETKVTTSAGMEAPKLDYHFVWWSFVLTFGLLFLYYFAVLRVSEAEFKKIIDAHFGPKQDGDG